MASTKFTAAVVAAVLSVGGGTALAQSSGQTADLARQVEELRARVAELEGQQKAGARDTARVVEEVLRDADRRTQLLATGEELNAGYDDKGFFIASGAFVLRPAVQFQFRYTLDSRSDTPGGDSQVDDGFELRRLRFDLAGSAFTPDFAYFFEVDANRDSGAVTLLEGWGRYMVNKDCGVLFGQFKDPVTHEFVMSTKRQLLADTSLADAVVGGGVTGYTQGVMGLYGAYGKDNPWNVIVGATDGANQANTNYTGDTNDLPVTAAPPAHSLDYGVTGRVEYKVMGDWSAYSQFTSLGCKNDTLVVGAGADFSQGGGDLLVATADVQYNLASGWGFYGAALAKYTEAKLSGLADDTTDWGLLAQGSYLFSQRWEAFARGDVTFLDYDVAAAGGEDTFPELTAGVNYYLRGHKAKITVDVTYLPSGAPAAYTGLGISGTSDGESEVVLRGQFQLLL